MSVKCAMPLMRVKEERRGSKRRAGSKGKRRWREREWREEPEEREE